MGLQVRLGLLLLAVVAVILGVNAVGGLWINAAVEARFVARDGSIDAIQELERLSQQLAAELQLRARDEVSPEVIAAAAEAREASIGALLADCRLPEWEARLAHVVAIRERLDAAAPEARSAVVFALADAQDALGRDLRVHIEDRVDQATAHAQRVRVGVLGSVLAALSLALLATVLVARRWVVRPFIEAEQVALALASGRRHVVITDRAPAEAGRLMMALSTLQGELLRAEERDRTQREALVVARDVAVQASETRQRFLAAISHELRTPLNGLLGALQLLGDGIPERDQPLLDAARVSSVDLHELVEDVLTFVSDGANDEERLENVAVRPWAERRIVEPRRRAHRKGLRLELAVAADVPERLRVDQQRLGRALHHLLDNAVKFTTEGGVVARITVEDACWLDVRIVDTGPGIPDGVLAGGESFVRGDGSWTRAHRGTGIGLGLVRSVARQQGGSLHVSSTAEGTEVLLRVPLVPASDDASGDGLALTR